jgi:hypothetical protein
MTISQGRFVFQAAAPSPGENRAVCALTDPALQLVTRALKYPLRGGKRQLSTSVDKFDKETWRGGGAFDHTDGLLHVAFTSLSGHQC